jgi:hypothetical protein
LLAATAAAQQQASPAPARGANAAVPSIQSGSLTPSGLNTDNLNYGDDIKRTFVGDFEHVSFKRDSTNFTLMVDTYMTEYSKSCAKYFPKDKAQIMQTICTNQVATVNQFGTEVDARRCTQYRTVGMGRYADPRVYALHKTLDSSVPVAVLPAYIQDLVPNTGNLQRNCAAGESASVHAPAACGAQRGYGAELRRYPAVIRACSRQAAAGLRTGRTRQEDPRQCQRKASDLKHGQDFTEEDKALHCSQRRYQQQ